MKHALKIAVKHALCALPTAALPGARILCYHAIGPRRHETTVSEDNFLRQMAWLAEQAQVVSLQQAVEKGEGVALTFDDGFVNNLELAAPILERFGFPATVFMVAGLAGGHIKGELDPAHGRLMDWAELREWRMRGFEVGGHTLTHPRLSELNEEMQRSEISGCKALLEEQLQTAVSAFAYPFGAASDYGAETMRLVVEAGYVFGLSNQYLPYEGPGNCFEIPRIRIDISDSLYLFKSKIRGRLDTLRYLEGDAALLARRLINRFGAA